jgi:hypothetical protein
MKGEVLCYCLAGVFVGANANAVPEASTYQQIPERNVFGLKAAQVVQPPVTAPTLPKIIPQGVTTILGNRLAIFKAQYAAKAPDPAKEVSMMLAEGQSEGGIEVLQIDTGTGSIKFNNNGTVMLLTLSKDGAKLPATPVAATPTPGVNAVPAPVQAGIPQPPNGILHPTNTGLKTIPGRRVAVPATAHGQGVQATNPAALSPEEQAVLLEVERERTKTQVQNGTLPPLPPTPLTPRPQ